MASTASVPVEPSTARPSFAKVAASSYKPQTTKEKPQKPSKDATSPQSSIEHTHTDAVFGSRHPEANIPTDEKERDGTRHNASTRTGAWADTAAQAIGPQPGPKDEGIQKSHPTITLVKSSVVEDNATQLSSSDGSAKPPSLDGKSVASATTFALDEKESIRPDDSASLRAVEEEDVTSPPDSVAAGSRVGSDSGVARAFHDQLHEIAVLGPHSQRGAPPGRFPNPTAVSPHMLYNPNQPSTGLGRPMSQPIVNGMPNVAVSHALQAGPDEKLIEALESPRDRLFVLKLEQDFIDFIKDSRENELALPNCNTFYRMLAHRLADYYLLGHIVDDTMTGVKITRTTFCRIPPPLSGLPVSTKNANTPPVDHPARKIMRRGEDGKSGTNTAANSEGPSKTTSEAGAVSGSDGGNEGNEGETRDKSSLTREEREARYREARQRIFGSSENGEGDSAEPNGSLEGKDVSRSSSASGKKKSKKQRNYDDDFEARSRFNVYYPQQYPIPGFGGEQTVYYSPYSGQMHNAQYPGVASNMSSPSNYGTGYPVMIPQDAQAQYGWSGQQYAPSAAPMGYVSQGPTQNGYDLSSEFQRSMSFQNTGIPSQMTPTMANPSMATYQDTYSPQPMSMNGGWSPMNQQVTYPVAQPPYQNGNDSRPMSAPGQGPLTGQYPYGQFPSSAYTGMPNRNQHPLPGSFNRQQFNPQSQAFVPGGRNMPYQMPTNAAPSPQGMNGYATYQMSAVSQMPNQMQNVSPPLGQMQAYGSPNGMHNNNSGASKSNSLGASQPPQLSNSQAAPSSSPPSQTNSSTKPAHSSIAKWGTPAHLPPKPPVPSQPQYFKANLPGRDNFSLPRAPVNMAVGYTSGPATMRGGASGSTAPNDQIV